jgi:hypothetical protein
MLCPNEILLMRLHCRFWTLLVGAANYKGEILSAIIDLARAKLICHHNISVKHTDLQPAALTAVLDVLSTSSLDVRQQAFERLSWLLATCVSPFLSRRTARISALAIHLNPYWRRLPLGRWTSFRCLPPIPRHQCNG